MKWLRGKRSPFQDPLDSGEVLARSGVNHLDRMRWVTSGDKSSALGNGRRADRNRRPNVPVGRLDRSAGLPQWLQSIHVSNVRWACGLTQSVAQGVNLHAWLSVAVRSIRKGGNQSGRVILWKKVIELRR